MALLDETGGKPLTGYGSGANSGAPVATPAEQAAALEAQASALQDDFNAMCKNGGGYAFAGEFCSAVVDEAVSLRYQATVLTHQGSPRNIVAPMAAVLWVGDRGAEFAKGTKKSASLLGRGSDLGCNRTSSASFTVLPGGSLRGCRDRQGLVERHAIIAAHCRND